jgi:radical SAM/Cys-rich protein
METTEQLKILRENAPPFEEKAEESAEFPLKALSLKTFQVNIGRKCNQACKHCHVNSSPLDEREMNKETVEFCLNAIRSTPGIEAVDLTGGAPEMNEYFRYFVIESLKAGKHVIDRCNLTILEEPGYENLYEFLAEHQVEIVASLPHFRSNTTDRQRGDGVFEKSILALQKLNKLGYGKSLPLNLVYNPTGLYISSSQQQLEREFKENLNQKFGIIFNNLYCINNIPINRFLESLIRAGKLTDYMEILVNAYNPCTIENLMCRHQVSVGYDGLLYDCDFNQMLDMKLNPIGHIKDFDYKKLVNRTIRTANHCYGCAAGSGSS